MGTKEIEEVNNTVFSSLGSVTSEGMLRSGEKYIFHFQCQVAQRPGRGHSEVLGKTGKRDQQFLFCVLQIEKNC